MIAAYHVYIAAARTADIYAEAIAHRLRAAGVDVVSTWHTGGKPVVDPEDETARLAIANACRSEVAKCTALVIVGYVGRPRGAYVEAGMAIAWGIPVIWIEDVGAIEQCVFNALPKSYRVLCNCEGVASTVAILSQLEACCYAQNL